MSKIYEYIFKATDQVSKTMDVIGRHSEKFHSKFSKNQEKFSGLAKNSGLSIQELQRKIDALNSKKLNLKDTEKGRKRIREVNGEITSLQNKLNYLKNLPPSDFMTRINKMPLIFKAAGSALIANFAFSRVSGFFNSSLDAFDKQEKAVAQVRQGLLTTGNSVGFTIDQLTDRASQLQSKTIFGDEEILQGVTAQLLTFTNIAGNQFDRTQTAAMDLATRLDGDLKSASIQLGKALNDPVSNLSQLSRSGIQFSDDQKQLIKTLSETGRLAEAQTVILDELEKQYGGSAEAAAKAGKGGWQNIANIFGDIQEKIGGVINKALEPLQPIIRNLAVGLDNNSELFEKIGNFASSAFEKIIGWARLVKPFVQQVFSSLSTLASKVWDFIGVVGESSSSMFDLSAILDIAGSIIDKVSSLAGVFIDVLSANWFWISKIIKIVTIATGVFYGFKIAFALLNAVMAVNPIFLVIGLIGGLIAAVVWAWDEIEGFKGTVYGLWEAFKTVFTNIGTLISNVVKNTIAPFIEAWNHVQNGDFGKASMSLGKGLLKANPIGVGAELLKGLNTITEGVSDAFSSGYEDGARKVASSKKAKSSRDSFDIDELGVKSSSAADFLNTDNDSGGLNLGDEIAKGNNSIIGGGSKQTNINVQFDKMIEELNIYADNVQGGIEDTEERLIQMMLRVLNSVNLMAK